MPRLIGWAALNDFAPLVRLESLQFGVLSGEPSSVDVCGYPNSPERQL